MRTRRRLAALAASAAATGALTVVPAGSAHAASGCWDTGRQELGFEAYDCYNVHPASVYVHPAYASGVGGTMYSDPSWFVCKTDYGAFNGETNGPHPYRWLFTKADVGTAANPSGEGWMSDKDIFSETNPVPNC